MSAFGFELNPNSKMFTSYSKDWLLAATLIFSKPMSTDSDFRQQGTLARPWGFEQGCRHVISNWIGVEELE